jgi:hypothetical protein
MKKVMISLGVIVGVIVIFAVISTLSAYNKIVDLETRIDAQHTANKSDYDKMWKTFVESTQVTELQAKQFKDVYTDLIAGRNNDTNLLVKMVQESNPQLGTDVYTTLQHQIGADRAKFSDEQTTLVDMIREYNKFVRQHFIISGFLHKNTIDADKYIVTSERTQGAFDSGKDGAIDLNSK